METWIIQRKKKDLHQHSASHMLVCFLWMTKSDIYYYKPEGKKSLVLSHSFWKSLKKNKKKLHESLLLTVCSVFHVDMREGYVSSWGGSYRCVQTARVLLLVVCCKWLAKADTRSWMFFLIEKQKYAVKKYTFAFILTRCLPACCLNACCSHVPAEKKNNIMNYKIYIYEQINIYCQTR